MNESSLRDKTLYIKVWKRLLSKWLFFDVECRQKGVWSVKTILSEL